MKAVGHTEECRSRIEANLLGDTVAARPKRVRARKGRCRAIEFPCAGSVGAKDAAQPAAAAGKKRLRGVKRKRTSRG